MLVALSSARLISATNESQYQLGRLMVCKLFFLLLTLHKIVTDHLQGGKNKASINTQGQATGKTIIPIPDV